MCTIASIDSIMFRNIWSYGIFNSCAYYTYCTDEFTVKPLNTTFKVFNSVDAWIDCHRYYRKCSFMFSLYLSK